MNITKGTITRTAILGLALTNQVLTIFGVSPIPVEDDTITNLISAGFTIGASVTAWWKNNSFTKKAIEADKTLHKAKGV